MDWYPWYFEIYKADTMHLDPYQDGCYRRLIDHYMSTRQPLPDNDHALARIIGDSHANWVAYGVAMVRPFFKAQKGLLFHAKCDEILNDQDNRTNKLSQSGKKGAEKRWSKINYIDSHPNSPPIATPMGSAIAQDRTIQDNKDRSQINNIHLVHFENFWKIYPKRSGANPKKTAQAKFIKLLESGENPEIIIAGAKAYASEQSNHGKIGTPYIAQAITWLNQERWLDYKPEEVKPWTPF